MSIFEGNSRKLLEKERFTHKKEKNNAICTTMDATRDYHTKSERERQIPYDVTYTWNLKYGANELIYKTETDTLIENRPVVVNG